MVLARVQEVVKDEQGVFGVFIGRKSQKCISFKTVQSKTSHKHPWEEQVKRSELKLKSGRSKFAIETDIDIFFAEEIPIPSF